MSTDSTPITLWCLEYRSNSFSITIGNNNSIFDLKKAIFEKINVPDNVKAKNLCLWNVNVEESQLESNTPDDLMTVENEIKIASQKVGNTFYGVQDNNIRVIVKVPVAIVEELKTLIDAPLLRKLPVTSDEEIMFPDISNYVCTTQGERRSAIAKINSNLFTIDTKFSGKSESMLHHPIDSMIRIPLENFNKYLGGSLPIDIDRDKSDSGSTTKGTQRPNFLCWIKKLLIFKGEEKANVGDFDTARIELVEKFNVLDPIFFGNIKFLICYAAAGSNVQFYAIDGSKETVKNPNQLMPLTGVLNSINLVDRITILRTTVNIARIMLTISDNITDMIIPLGKKQKLGHSYITFFANSVVKLVPEVDLPYTQHLQSRVRFLTSMYKHAKDQRMYKVKMTTQGIPCKLNNENDVREMTKCVLTGLARLHAGRYVHRDIRIPNIVFVPEHHDNFRYVLIDFEHGGMNKQKPGENLNGWDANTLTKSGHYVYLSEMYQLGKMLEKYNDLMTAGGKDFVNQLKSKNLTAEEALKHTWINNSTTSI
ncbi:18019_t:CDS:2 [Rhizophagus irregularis]|nr:18019_t:CDS:2 [Rhizophagus irregularis]